MHNCDPEMKINRYPKRPRLGFGVWVLFAMWDLGLGIFCATAGPASPAISPVIPSLAHPLPLSAVRLTGGPLKHAEDLDVEYLLKLEPDRMLFHLRKRAGLEPKAKQGYGGWD